MNNKTENLNKLTRVELEGTLETIHMINNDCDEYLDWIERFGTLNDVQMVKEYLKKIANELGKEDKI